jgi:hypothetical protein
MSSLISESKSGAMNWKICKTKLHAAEDVAPGLDAYVPDLQLLQADCPKTEYVPALHVEQTAEAVPPDYHMTGTQSCSA